jgi:hypothetical protein
VRNWEGHVRSKLAGILLEPDECGEVIEELAAHLEQTCLELRGQGMTEEVAIQVALGQVQDWSDLRRRIQSAKTKENSMSKRVTQFWFPSLLTLVLSMGLLMLIQIFGPQPWLVGWNGRGGWTFIAPALLVYLPWLLSLPLIGAMGAYLSIRAGGSKHAMLTSVVFPVLPYLAFFVVALPVMAILNDRIAHTIMIGALFMGQFAWVLAPGGALLAGGWLAQAFLLRRLDSRRLANS